MSSSPILPTPRPRFWTPRTEGLRTFGPKVGQVSAALGRPLMPWQQYVADVAFEVDENGLFVHPLVIVSVPRQSGKTALVLSSAVHRCLMGRRRKAWITAQTGMAARTRWREQAEEFDSTPLGKLCKTKYGAGDSRMIFANGSQFAPHSPKIDALHGEQSDLNIIDEGWSFTEEQGTNLMQAIVPTQATRPGAQTVLTSTMGTADSTWFHDLCDRGRDGDPAVCYFEWSIPEDADPLDLDVVAAHHPAVGHTINRKVIDAAAGQLLPGEFARAYGNRRTGAGERLVPLELWRAAQSSLLLPSDARVAFGVAVSLDRSETCICAAALVDGVPVVEVVDLRAGSSWAGARVQQLAASHSNVGIAVDRHGPSMTVGDDLDLKEVPLLLPVDTRAVCTAAADLLDRLQDGRVRFRPDAAFDRGMDVLAKRAVGDGFAFSRRVDTGTITAIEAASLAVWGLVRDRGPAKAPMVRFG